MAKNSGLMLGAIADDLTGATDLALTLARGGMNVRQIVGVPESQEMFGDAEAVVISLKSRTIAKEIAVAQALASARVLLDAGARQLFFKYCSTFDSTDKGNIGPVIEALLDLLGENGTLACPAFPTNKRTVYMGHHFVGDQLLSNSSMKDHPLTPMRDSNLVQVLGRQTRLDVSLIDISTVRAPTEELCQAFADLNGVAIVDALNDEDLLSIGRAARGLKLITGGSGVALGLPGNFPLLHAKPESELPPSTGRAVVLSGSCSAATRRQVARAIEAGAPAFRIDPLELANNEISATDAVAFAIRSAANSIPVIYASDTPGSVARVQAKLGTEKAGSLIEDFLAATAAGLASAGFSRFLVAGGESSGAVIAGLKIKALVVGPEIDLGVPWMFSNDTGRPVALALKSGNFGAEDIFLTAWEKLE